MQSGSEQAEQTNVDDVVDLSVLKSFEEAQSEGEPDLIVELIDLYLADAPRQLSVIKDSILNGDQATLKRAVHTLKGSSANLGVKALAALCEEIERTDVGETFRQPDVIINRLEQIFARIRSILLTERESRT